MPRPFTFAIFCALLVSAPAGSLVGCATAIPNDKVLRVGLQDDLKTLDPAIGYDEASWGAEHLIFQGLVRYDFNSEVVPDLARSWTVSPDGKRYVFTLKPGLRFQDGRPLRASDVAASFNRLLDPAAQSPGASFYTDIVGAADRLKGKASQIAGIQPQGDNKVLFTLKSVNPVFMQLLAMPFASVLPAGSGAEVARHPLGSGPFRLVEWRSGERMRFERNPYYLGQPSALDGVEYQLGLNESLETLRFERGQLDLLGVNREISAADFAELKQNPRYAKLMLKGPDAAIHYLGLNCQMPPFDKLAVRQAVAMAIDKARIVQLVNGRGTPANGILPPGVPGFNKALKGYRYDPTAAKVLLAHAGFPNGFTSEYYCVSNDTAIKIASSIQQDLAKIGIRLTLKPLAFPTYLDAKATAGRVPVGSGNWTQDYPDASDFLTTLFDSRNMRQTDSLDDTFYKNQQVDKWLNAADHTLDPAKRITLFQRAETQIIHDAPAIPLYYPVKFQLHSARVVGYRLHPIWPMELTGVHVVVPSTQ